MVFLSFLSDAFELTASFVLSSVVPQEVLEEVGVASPI